MKRRKAAKRRQQEGLERVVRATERLGLYDAELDSGSTHVTPVGGNVFADLGFGQDEAAALLAKADVAVARNVSRPRVRARRRG